MKTFSRGLLLAIIGVFIGTVAMAADGPAKFDMDWALRIQERYDVTPDVTYVVAKGFPAKLDVYARKDGKPHPTVIYIHGGGWLPGFTKDGSQLGLLPYLQAGWNVINVDYRPSGVALAPAAVEDCLCALKWVYHNAKQYNLDTKRIVVTGASAGGHLALTTGMIPPAAGLSGPCTANDVLSPIEGPVKVGAIVNWFGITDVADLLQGENEKSYAVMWLGSQANRPAIAKQTSPMSYVRADLPPILSIHGDKDPIVPYPHATRLHAGLAKAGVVNRLVTISGGDHGNFSAKEMRDSFTVIFDFLAKAGIKPEFE